jgi:hypothetical protein
MRAFKKLRQPCTNPRAGLVQAVAGNFSDWTTWTNNMRKEGRVGNGSDPQYRLFSPRIFDHAVAHSVLLLIREPLGTAQFRHGGVWCCVWQILGKAFTGKSAVQASKLHIRLNFYLTVNTVHLHYKDQLSCVAHKCSACAK